ncbi:hypothetical protein [Deinococcus murrayi]|uniref:hypothetical protein n=1 Tax=Deinococcus murrayi TaxID=68910 RepID=UPI00048444BD|nr:hypothetical protein [Deinococcus murrayi]
MTRPSVTAVRRIPQGARLTLSAPAQLFRLDLPALYTLPAHLIRPAALALGFDPRQLAHVLGERPCHD